MNWKIVIASHWRVALLMLQLGLLMLTIITVTPLGDPIDNPVGPVM